ncbi:MAG: nitrilase-related carbon-nitrogen hydrolase, partial [Bacteroidota bacterium]
MSNLQLTLVQANLVWENKEANRRQLDDLVSGISIPNELIIFPEMFTTGFSMRPDLFAEKDGNETFTWLKDLSAKKNMVVCGSLMFEENGA